MLSNRRDRKPRLSIGLPVFNGENYLAAALDSILAQTYRDFELIISDNASTDRTEEICLSYAAKDRRVHYFRNRTNIGGGRNFNRAFELASGEYFKWHAHDDLLRPEFLARCVEVLDNDPSIILVHSKTGRIEEDGVLVGAFDHNMNVGAHEPHERLRSLLMERNIAAEQFGVIRSKSLGATRLMGNYVACDRNLLAELALLGRWHIIPEYLFLRRQHRDAGTNIWPLQARIVWYEPRRPEKLNFPHFREVAEHLNVIRRSPLSMAERWACYSVMARYLLHLRKGLSSDTYIAAVRTIRRFKLGGDLIDLTKRLLYARNDSVERAREADANTTAKKFS